MANLHNGVTFLGFASEQSRSNKPKPDQDNWSDTKWLMWFLGNYSAAPLIESGVWKRPKFIAADFESRPEALAAIRASYLLQGDEFAMVMLAECLRQFVEELNPDYQAPELPTDWAERVRWRYQYAHDPTRGRMWGYWRQDK